MLLSERDADLLRLVYWCQYILPSDAQSISSKEEIADLVRLGLLKLHKNSGAYVITGRGILLLRDMLDGKCPEVSQSYHAAAIERRLRLSALALTAYRAGLNLFTSSTEDLIADCSLFLTVHGRARGKNPWGSTRIAAVAHMGGLVCGFHAIYPEIGNLALTDEMGAFENNTNHVLCESHALFFAGKSYGAVIEELKRQSRPEKQSKLVPYREAYHSLELPIHLLSCDEVGAMQLKIMSIPHYRMKLTKAALAPHYRSPPEDAPEWDAMYGGCPVILAADMNLHRIDAGIARAKERGHARVSLLSLQEQVGVLLSRYREDCFVGFYCLSDPALQRFSDVPMRLHRPRPTQYLTEKGGVIDTPLIQSYRKAGR